MVKHPGYCLLLFLLGGCATQPAAPVHGTLGPRTATRTILPQAAALPIRVGVEHLDVGHAFCERHADPGIGGSRGLVTDASSTHRSVEALAVQEEPRPARPNETRIGKGDEPTRRGLVAKTSFERVTLRFIEELSGYDLHHEPRGLDEISMREQLRVFAMPEMRDRYDERTEQERAELLERWQSRLIGGPLRRALKESPIVRDAELALDLFKADNVPLSEPYQDTHPRHVNYGRLSLRVRPSTPNDMVELVYVREHWRAGTSQDRAKISYSTPLADKLDLSLRGRYGYSERVWELDASLEYRLSRRSHAHLLVSNHLDLLSEPISNPAAALGIADSPGVLFFIQHLF